MYEEEKILRKITQKIEEVLDKEFKKYGLDRAFFEFIVKVNILSPDFEKINEIELINEEKEGHFCSFCGRFTRFYARDRDLHICPKCLNELQKV